MGPAQGMQIPIWALIMPILSVLFLLLLIVSNIITTFRVIISFFNRPNNFA